MGRQQGHGRCCIQTSHSSQQLEPVGYILVVGYTGPTCFTLGLLRFNLFTCYQQAPRQKMEPIHQAAYDGNVAAIDRLVAEDGRR